MTHGKRAPALALGVLLVLVALPTVRTLAAGDAVYLAGPSDFVALFAPASEYFHDRVRSEHEAPLWRTSQFYGHELLGEPYQRLLYPPFWIYAAFATPLAHALYLLLHGLLLAAGMYALARGERCSPLAALFAGLTVALSFKSFAYLAAGWDNITGAIAWIPLALAFFRRALRERGWEQASLMGGALALSCLAGLPTFFFYLAPALPLAALGESRRRRARLVTVLLVGFGVGFALASPQLLCSIETGSRSARSDLRVAYGTTLPADVIGALAFPDFTHGDLSWEHSNALGLAVLPLAAAGIARRRRIPFAAWLGAIFLVLAAGYHTPVGALLEKVPLVGSLSYVSRLLWVVAIALALLAARGLDALLRLDEKARRSRRLTVGLAAGAALFLVGAVWPGRAERIAPHGFSHGGVVLVFAAAVAASLALLPRVAAARRRRLLVALVAFTAVELLVQGELVLERVSWSELTKPTAIDAALAREPLARVAAVTSKSLWSDPVVPFYGARGTERADGYDPLHQRDTERFLYSIARDRFSRRWDPYVGLQAVDRPGLLALGITHVVAHEPLEGFEVVARDTPRIFSGAGEWIEEPVFLLRVPGAMPRAYLMTHAFSEGDETQRAALRRGRFEPRKTLLLEGPVPAEGGNDGPLPVTVVEHRANFVRLEASVPEGGGWVVLLDSWSPSWTAEVDAKPARIERANAIFRAVRVEAGERTVTMRIGAPREFWIGVALAGVTLLVVLLRIATARRKGAGVPSSAAARSRGA